MSDPLRLTNDLDATEGRFARFALMGWWDQSRLASAKVLVIGAGALGNEILKNLALLGVGNVFVALLRTRQFHAVRTTNEPSVHHGVGYFRMELQSIAGAQPERLDRKSVAFGQEFTAGW